MWKPIDTDFFQKYLPVQIADYGGVGDDPQKIRSMLESLGAVVHLHRIGTPEDFLKVISQGEQAAPYLILCGHGEDDGLTFDDYAPNIDASMLVNKCIPPKAIAQHVNLPGCLVLNEACGGGEKAMAEAFMQGGLKAYIGHTFPSPIGQATPVFFMHFFYKRIWHKCSVRDAWEQAASYDEHSRCFVLYDEEGLHKI